MAAGITLGNAQASLDGGTTWIPVVSQNIALYSTSTHPVSASQWYWRPATSISWSWPAVTWVVSDRGAFDRRHLAWIAERLPLVEPRSLVAVRLERRPELVRRAPRPAGRPSGWRRARKGGRRT